MAPAPRVPLVAGMILKLEAVSPTTGAAITGVTCSSWAIYGTRSDDGTADTLVNPGPFMLVPGPNDGSAGV